MTLTAPSRRPRLSAALALLILLTPHSFAAVKGFQEQYHADVGGTVWSLQLSRNMTMISGVMGNLSMGDLNSRLVMIGTVRDGVFSGGYKPYYGVSNGEQPFSLTRISDSEALLKLEGFSGFPADGLTFRSDARVTTIDNEMLGVWGADIDYGVNASQPHMAEQMAVHYRSDGSLCEQVFELDTRKDESASDPCDRGEVRYWKVEQNKVFIADSPNGRWEEAYSYRFMGGHLFISYRGAGDEKVQVGSGFASKLSESSHKVLKRLNTQTAGY